jgi:hypothetical protein
MVFFFLLQIAYLCEFIKFTQSSEEKTFLFPDIGSPKMAVAAD